MSKSLGNGIDPLEVIDQFGADALRFMLTTGITPGNDMRFKEDKLESSRNFANKLWNASRFVIMNLQDEDGNFKELAKCCGDCCGMACGDTTNFSNIALRDEDKWIISRVNDAVEYVTNALEKYDLALAGQRVYELIWNEYCDWYIELVKKRLWGDDEEDKKVVRFVLVMVLKKHAGNAAPVHAIHHRRNLVLPAAFRLRERRQSELLSDQGQVAGSFRGETLCCGRRETGKQPWKPFAPSEIFGQRQKRYQARSSTAVIYAEGEKT